MRVPALHVLKPLHRSNEQMVLAKIDGTTTEIVGWSGPTPTEDRQRAALELLEQLASTGAGQDAELSVVERFTGADGLEYVTLRLRSGDTGHETILVIDDHLTNREYYVELLSDEGHSVEVAADGAAGFDAARRLVPDLIMLDVRLPDTNGYELCRRLRSDDALMHVPVLLHTAHPLAVDETHARAAGSAGLMLTPADPDTVLAALSNARVGSLLEPQASEGVGLGSDSHLPEPQLRCFGSLALRVPDGTWHEISSPRGGDLLGILVARHPNPVNSSELSAHLFSGDSSRSGAVYTAVSRVRRLLSNLGEPDLLDAPASGYTLNLSRPSIDVFRFLDRSGVLLDNEDELPRRDALEEALALYNGDPFDSSRVRVIADFRARVCEMRARLTQRLGVELLGEGRNASAVERLRDLVASEPWHEKAWVLLAVGLYRSAQQRDALNVLASARTRLLEELGLNPGPDIVECEQMILNQDPSILDDRHLVKWLSL